MSIDATSNPLFQGIAEVVDYFTKPRPDPGPEGSWEARPASGNDGKQVEELDVVVIRVLGRGYLDNDSFDMTKGTWVGTKDKDGDGGQWRVPLSSDSTPRPCPPPQYHHISELIRREERLYVASGSADAAAAKFVVRKEKAGNNTEIFCLQLRGTSTAIANHGDWVNCYKPQTVFEVNNRAISFTPWEQAYKMRFKTASNEVTSADYLNVKRSGGPLYFFIHTVGKADNSEAVGLDFS